MKKVFLIILFITITLMGFSKGVPNFTRYVCGQDTLKPWILIEKDNVTGEKVAYYIKQGSTIYNPPIANAGEDKTLAQNQTNDTLDGSGSHAQDGATISSYLWTKVSGGTSTIVSPNSVTTIIKDFGAVGDFTYKLTVTDSHGLSGSDNVTITVPELKPDEYYLLPDSAKFNFTPLAQNVSGWTDVVGDPSNNVLTATDNGITVSTIGTTLWGKANNDSSSGLFGMTKSSNDDPYAPVIDTAVTQSGFLNNNSQYSAGNNNLKLSGLDPNLLYRIEIFGSLDEDYAIGNLNNNSDIFATRTEYYINDNRSHNLNTWQKISKSIIFDTVAPKSNGEIDIAITGENSSYQYGSTGFINAMKINPISKNDSLTGSKKIALFHYNYDTTLNINDGVVSDRLCVIYKPKNYNPAKKYPLMIYLTGQESTVNNNWDAEMVLQEGVPFAAENNDGDIYGIDKNGDTVRWVIIAPQTKLAEWSVPPNQLANIVKRFKEKGLYNLNDTTDITSFSSGALQALNYIFKFPDSIKAAYLIDPAVTIADTTNTWIENNTSNFVANGGMIMLSSHGSSLGLNADSVAARIVRAGGEGHVDRNYFQVAHRAFSTEYKVGKVNELYNQDLYDWLANPVYRKYAMFVLTNSATHAGTWNIWSGTGAGPNTAVHSWTDATTGWGANTVSTSTWINYVDATDVTQPFAGIYYNKKYWINDWTMKSYASGWKTQGSYAANGANLEVTGLTPGSKYTVEFISRLDSTKISGYKTEYTINGENSIIDDPYLPYNDNKFPTLSGIADSNGNLNIGVYPAAGATYGSLGAFMVMEDSSIVKHKAPLVNAGSDQQIYLPIETVNLSGSAINLNAVGGTITNTLWNLFSEPAGASAAITNDNALETSVTNLAIAGSYELELKATDDSGYISRDTMIVTVFPQASNSVTFNLNATAQSVSGTVDASGTPSSAVITATDATTGWTISSVSTSRWRVYGPTTSSNSNGSTVDDGGGFAFGIDVGKSSWYGAWLDTTSVTPAITISNLNTAKVYNISILSSISTTSGAVANKNTYIHLNESAGTFKQINSWGNTSTTINYNQIVPKSDGTINIDLNTASDTQAYFIINGIKITEQTAP